MNTTVVYLTNDLMFSSRVRSLAQAAGVGLAVVGGLAALQEQLASAPIELILVDLGHPEADMERVMELAAGMTPRPRTVAYASHVKESLLDAARVAGCDLVLPRGQFDRQIGSLLATR